MPVPRAVMQLVTLNLLAVSAIFETKVSKSLYDGGRRGGGGGGGGGVLHN